jgi:hypothetical protein
VYATSGGLTGFSFLFPVERSYSSTFSQCHQGQRSISRGIFLILEFPLANPPFTSTSPDLRTCGFVQCHAASRLRRVRLLQTVTRHETVHGVDDLGRPAGSSFGTRSAAVLPALAELDFYPFLPNQAPMVHGTKGSLSGDAKSPTAGASACCETLPAGLMPPYVANCRSMD